MNDTERLAAIREREAKATPGPWTFFTNLDDQTVVQSGFDPGVDSPGGMTLDVEVYSYADDRPLEGGHTGGAAFSPCPACGRPVGLDGRCNACELPALYRYNLTRRWGPGLLVLWVMLNPSTADARALDPTLRRCAGYARRWGYGGMVIRNLFALRSTDPKGLRDADDPVGPANDDWLGLHPSVDGIGLTMVGWGQHVLKTVRPEHRMRWFEAARLLTDPHCVGRCAGTPGMPKHPLYQPADADPVPWGVGQS